MNNAYEALADAEYVLKLLEECDDKRLFRIYFVTCITLLRTVGQVLVRKSAEQRIRDAVTKVFNNHKADNVADKIYFEFIKKERDIIVHEYDINLDCNDWEVVYPDGVDFGLFNLGELYRPLTDLSFQGQDVRDLLGDGVKWWKTQLAEIEKELKKAI